MLNSETHEPVRRAAIKVSASKKEWDELTDGEGRFKFPSLEPGEYTLIARRAGYSDSFYKVERSDFDQKAELPIELRPQGVIAGKVLDGFGQALQSASIEALGARTRNGELEVIGSAKSNDLGEYRVSGLDLGTYRLRATYQDGRNGDFDPTPLTTATAYYGSSEKPAEIAVQSGSLTPGIDFILNPARPVRIRGTLHSETGVLAERVALWITGIAGQGGHSDQGTDGKFEIGDVAPGTYLISAETLSESALLAGMATVDVRGADVDGIDLVLHPAPKIEGEIRVEGRGSSSDAKLTQLFFMGTDHSRGINMRIAHPDQDQKFQISLIPGEYYVSIGDSINKLDVLRMALDDKPVTGGKLKVGASADGKKLLIVVGTKAQP